MRCERSPTFLERYGAFMFRQRNIVFPVVVTALLIAFRPELPWGSPVADRWLEYAGAAAVLAGSVLRFLVSGLAEIRLGGLGKRVHAEALHTDGVFALCRNPLYVANLTIVLGLFLVVNNWWVWLLGGAFFLVSYRAIVAAEERYLREKFGQAYADYCRRVPRWGVNPRGLLETVLTSRFDWARAVVKEYSPIATNGLALLAILAWDSVTLGSPSGSRHALLACGATAALLIGVCAAARHYKKSGRYRPRSPA